MTTTGAATVDHLLRTGTSFSVNMPESDPETHAMSCAAARKVVYEFLDDELRPADAASVNRHLLACPPCAGFFNFEHAYLLVLKRRPTIESAPSELRERLRAALASRSRPQRLD